MIIFENVISKLYNNYKWIFIIYQKKKKKKKIISNRKRMNNLLRLDKNKFKFSIFLFV